MSSSALLFFQQKTAEWWAFDATSYGDVIEQQIQVLLFRQKFFMSSEFTHLSVRSQHFLWFSYFLLFYLFISDLMWLWWQFTKVVLQFAFAFFISRSPYEAVLRCISNPLCSRVLFQHAIHTGPLVTKVHNHPPSEKIFSNLLLLLSGSFLTFLFQTSPKMIVPFS